MTSSFDNLLMYQTNIKGISMVQSLLNNVYTICFRKMAAMGGANLAYLSIVKYLKTLFSKLAADKNN